MAIHDRSLVLHGGGEGLRDSGLLDSALNRPKQIKTYQPDADIVALAAAYTVGIVKNHPFIDGNKRVGFVAGVVFLELNEYVFLATEVEAAQAVLDLAAGLIDESDYTKFLRENARYDQGQIP